MFTGIVETVGEISSVSRAGGDLRLEISAPDLENKGISLGDSIAINGLCLTIVAHDNSRLSFDVSIESLDHSLIGTWQPGNRVNLELAMLPTTRLGGHLVSGHVDGLAELTGLESDARSWRMVFEAPEPLQKYIAKKGSITINGVSLTVNEIDNNHFNINVIPHTIEVTTLGELQIGDQVHVEVDLIARYLERLLAGEARPGTNISESFLAEHGFN